jgi:site-specific DNA-cytosine methylase
MGGVYYNEIDPYCAQWLRNLMDADLIPRGDIDTRSIEDVRPDELRGYTQCHFFAGLGGWPYALQLAGWDTRPVWTGSCPCQPFSVAGKGAGFADERHLWPSWQHLISQCNPPIILGEQVASATQWLGLVCGDLEGMGYAVGFNHIEAASAGADHRRDRIFFVADTECARHRCEVERGEAGQAKADRSAGGLGRSGDGSSLAQANLSSSGEERPERSRQLGGFGGDPQARYGWIVGHDGKARRVVSDLRSVVDGLSESLAGLRAECYAEAIKEVIAYATATQQRPGEILRTLRSEVAAQTIWQVARGFFSISEAEILLPYMRELERRIDKSGVSSTVTTNEEESLRSVRLSARVACPPQERELHGQSSGEHPNALHVLSQFLARAAGQAFDALSRDASILRLLEEGVPARVGKLRALGNAIDPRPAAAFITAYMQARGYDEVTTRQSER